MATQYYNKTDVELALWTEGNEFQITPEYSGESYVGYYHTDKGYLYTDPSPITERQPLYPYVAVNKTAVRKYNIIKDTLTPLRPPPLFHLPKPAVEDITNGYIVRYIVQRVPDLIITEITYEQFDSMGSEDGIDAAIYNKNAFRWKITGTDKSIRFVNSGKLNNMEYDMPGISDYFNDLLEFSEYSPVWANQY